MDPSAKKLVDEYERLRRQRVRIDRTMDGIRTSLTIMGIRVDDGVGFMDRLESKYADQKPFREASLGQACLKVLADHEGFRLDKGQVEFLLTLGGYPFEAKDPTNSVEVTLRKLAADGKCEVDRQGGPLGNRYGAVKAHGNAKSGELDEVESSATKTPEAE